jgi:hypothetical protein
MKLLERKINVLDICDCVFARETGPAAGSRADVRSSQTWQRTGTWVFDPELSEDLNQYWLGSSSRD